MSKSNNNKNEIDLAKDKTSEGETIDTKIENSAEKQVSVSQKITLPENVNLRDLIPESLKVYKKQLESQLSKIQWQMEQVDRLSSFDHKIITNAINLGLGLGYDADMTAKIFSECSVLLIQAGFKMCIKEMLNNPAEPTLGLSQETIDEINGFQEEHKTNILNFKETDNSIERLRLMPEQIINLYYQKSDASGQIVHPIAIKTLETAIPSHVIRPLQEDTLFQRDIIEKNIFKLAAEESDDTLKKDFTPTRDGSKTPASTQPIETDRKQADSEIEDMQGKTSLDTPSVSENDTTVIGANEESEIG